jgi:hypothetical protein
MECLRLGLGIGQESEFDMASPATQPLFRRRRAHQADVGQSIEAVNGGFNLVGGADRGPSQGRSTGKWAERFGKKTGKGLTPKQDPRILGSRYRTSISGKVTSDRSELWLYEDSFPIR